MQPTYRQYLIALGMTLCASTHLLGQVPTYTTIDYPRATSTTPWGINNRGDIAGLYVNADKTTHGFRLSAGEYTSVDFPGAVGTEVYGIGSTGDLVGVYTMDGVRRGFLLKSGQFTKIDFPGAVSTETSAIDPRGEIVGFYVNADKSQHGFLLSGTQFTTVDFPGGVANLTSGINPEGDIAGSYDGHAYLLSEGDFIRFDVAGSTFTNTTGINAARDIVGRYVSGGVSHGYLLTAGRFSTIDYPGATFAGATGINQRGDILGRYRNSDGVTHGFLMTGYRAACVTPSSTPQIGVTAGGAAVAHASDFTLVTAVKPAAAGEILSIFATGLGPTRPAVAAGQPFAASPLTTVDSLVEVQVNGRSAIVLGAYGLPGTVDGYQINFLVPSDVVKGSATLRLSAGTVPAASVNIMVQ